MSIKRVNFSALFWETLLPLRPHARYHSFRGQIEELLRQWATGEHRASARDKVFNSETALGGIWHFHLSRQPDVVLFYVVSGDTLTLAMMGDHSDYCFSGSGRNASLRTAARIKKASTEGHEPSPQWKSLAWKRPSDLSGDPYLHEASFQALGTVLEALQAELEEPFLYSRLHGQSIYDAPEAAFSAWIDETEDARRAVLSAMERKPTTPEKALEAVVTRQAAFARP